MRILVIGVLFYFFLGTKACTEIRVTAKDSSVIIGRTMEYTVETYSNIITEPEGYNHSANDLPEGCPQDGDRLTWSNKYSLAYVNGWGLIDASVDGMNSAGLSVGGLMFPGFAKYEDVPLSKCGQAISQVQVTQWLLGNFGTVKEVNDSMASGSFPLVFGATVFGIYFEGHVSVYDKSGNGIVVEYTAMGKQVYDNSLGTMTNSPPYPFHMLNLRNYVQVSKHNNDPLKLGPDEFPPTGEGSGLIGLPGDLTPPSRFVRAAVFKEFATTPKTNKAAVNLAFHVLNTVNIPRGVISKPFPLEAFGDYTVWSVAKDLTNNAFYFRYYNDFTVRVVYLDNVQQGQRMTIKMYSDEVEGFQDVTNDMQPVSTAQENFKRSDEL